MKIYFATWTEDNQRVSLNARGARRRLLSYYFLLDAGKNYLRRYCSGRLDDGKRDKSKKQTVIDKLD